MKPLILFVLLLPVAAHAEPARFWSLYDFYTYHHDADLSIPLCQQEQFKQYSYVDERCYTEVPFDYSAKCYEWNCPVPYEHVFIEPITGTRKVVEGDWEEVDQNYRAARSMLAKPEARTAAPVTKKKKRKHRRG